MMCGKATNYDRIKHETNVIKTSARRQLFAHLVGEHHGCQLRRGLKNSDVGILIKDFVQLCTKSPYLPTYTSWALHLCGAQTCEEKTFLFGSFNLFHHRRPCLKKDISGRMYEVYSQRKLTYAKRWMDRYKRIQNLSTPSIFSGGRPPSKRGSIFKRPPDFLATDQRRSKMIAKKGQADPFFRIHFLQ